MALMLKQKRLLTPGPVPIPSAVREMLSQPIVHHRTAEFEATLKFCLESLQRIFATDDRVLIHACTGSGGMESALINTLSPGDEVVCVVSGKFGERWAYMAEVFGLHVQRLEVPWGEAADLTRLEALLEKHPAAKAVLTQACETSTATLHPIREMARLVRSRTSALFMVDAITAAGCMPMPMKEWGLDVVVAGSQKAFMLPTGLSFVGISKNAWQASQRSLQSGFYFDWAQEVEANKKNQTFFSSPTSMILALSVVLKEIEKAGMARIQARCEALAEGTRQAGAALGLEVFSKSPSPSVTALTLPEAIDGEKLRDWLEQEQGITVMGGQERLKGRVLRIGHMGDISDDDMIAFFTALAAGLNQFHPPINANGRLAQALDRLRQSLQRAPRLFS
jgi:aspartate aminotransferase-like enzyme